MDQNPANPNSDLNQIDPSNSLSTPTGEQPFQVPEANQASSVQVDASSPPVTPQPTPVTPDPIPGAAPTLQPESVVQSATPAVVVGGFDAVDNSAAPALTNSATPTDNILKPASPKKKWQNPFKMKKAMLFVIAPIVILGGGVAAAYVGVIVPNKPANVLKSAIINSLQQPDVSGSGSLQDSRTSTSSGIAYKVNINTEVNRPDKAVDLSLNITVSGINVPVEARIVNGNAYFKFGDLSTVGTLLSSLSPSSSSQIQSLTSKLSNHWFSVDSTIIDESSTLKCFMNLNWTTSNSDTQTLENAYSKHSFIKIDSTTTTTLNGQKVEEFKLGINDDKEATFLESLSSSSIFQQVDKCGGSKTSDVSSEYKSLADNDTTPVTLWINKSTKQIVQASSNSTAKDAKSGVVGNGTVSISYKPVSISAPSNAQSVVQLLTMLESQSTNSSSSSSSSNLNLSSLLSSF
jgi:hypothetical protein